MKKIEKSDDVFYGIRQKAAAKSEKLKNEFLTQLSMEEKKIEK